MFGDYKKFIHSPPHLFCSNTKYFITGATYKKIHYMKNDQIKKIFLKYFFSSFNYYGWQIEDWVVLNNHYHLMANAPENAETLSQVINNIHRFSSLAISKFYKNNMECIDCVNTASTQSMHSKEKKFHNYWDTCITFKKSYYARLNYIWFNPVKHGYVDDPIKWKFGSYYYRFKKEKQKLKNIIGKYPCDRVKIDDNF